MVVSYLQSIYERLRLGTSSKKQNYILNNELNKGSKKMFTHKCQPRNIYVDYWNPYKDNYWHPYRYGYLYPYRYGYWRPYKYGYWHSYKYGEINRIKNFD